MTLARPKPSPSNFSTSRRSSPASAIACSSALPLPFARVADGVLPEEGWEEEEEELPAPGAPAYACAQYLAVSLKDSREVM